MKNTKCAVDYTKQARTKGGGGVVMASRRINVSSADLADSLLEFINDDTNNIFIDESKTFSTLIHVDEDNHFWNGELSQLKSFVQNILKLTGIWTSQ